MEKTVNIDSNSLSALVHTGPKNYGSSIPAIRLFLYKYHDYPCTLDCETDSDDIRYHATSIVEYLAKKMTPEPMKDTIARLYHRRSKKLYINNRLVDLGQGIMIEFPDCDFDSDIKNPNKLPADHNGEYFVTAKTIRILYLPELDQVAQDLFHQFSAFTVFSSTSCKLELVCRNKCGFYLNSIRIKKPLITDLALHYGQKFVPVHDKIIKSLNEKQGKGIVLLHGIPGSGKTHYIRYLIQEIKDKTLIYIPPDMAKEISSPQFLPFLMEYPDSILIIEDAENIIKDRNETLVPSQAVANLLNLSDGLLGDAMHQQIIATFNCDLKTIDAALLRKGRLIANHEFDKLDTESSKILSEKLGYGTEGVTGPMTLAEIFNQNDQEIAEEKNTSD